MRAHKLSPLPISLFLCQHWTQAAFYMSLDHCNLFMFRERHHSRFSNSSFLSDAPIQLRQLAKCTKTYPAVPRTSTLGFRTIILRIFGRSILNSSLESAAFISSSSSSSRSFQDLKLDFKVYATDLGLLLSLAFS